jgi:protein gp37
MATNSKIEWTHHTESLVGCTKVHTGCDNCYALNLATRWETTYGR